LKTVKNTISIICAILLFSLLAACNGKTAGIRDDVEVSDLSASVAAALNEKDTLVSVPETFFSGAMKMDVSDYEGFDVKINSHGVNIDEYGIFKAADSSQVASLEQALNDYLKLRKDTWMVEYMPEEYPKLENAEVKIVGNYAMYAILSDDSKKAAFDAFEKSLTA
jgi:predicted small secreted protein